MSSGRSVRGGIRAFLLGAEPRGRNLSGVHRSEEGGENTEEEEEEDEGKEGTETGGGAGGGSSTDTVRGPGREEKNRWTNYKIRKDKKGGGERGEDCETDTRRRRQKTIKREERGKTRMLKY